MAIVVRLTSPDDVSEIVEGLLTAAEARQTAAPDLANRWRNLAHNIGDALDQLPTPATPET
ncbi:hypothetical protein [Streptomyces caniscabiei]|uniref:hypothetical protein n=1 Tax=Streptomyces caniscabiei TaxID=2746961 RepID=UPI0018724DA6|nr:hypothetical protein [Streptomyces caniscabiei]MBE4783945.1 hypothetical protein [Streptomyces caniscabiei]MBE4791556.1 hypothetical protein [Streptomyces caniscabiei]MDX3009207.1 hypothetical protein [Streptomyces caniscabiei]